MFHFSFFFFFLRLGRGGNNVRVKKMRMDEKVLLFDLFSGVGVSFRGRLLDAHVCLTAVEREGSYDFL